MLSVSSYKNDSQWNGEILAMVKRIYAAGVAAALGLALPLLTPVEVAAKSGAAGLGAHFSLATKPAHIASWRAGHHHHRHAFRRRPLVVSVAGVAPDYDLRADAGAPLLAGFAAPTPSPRVLSCRHNLETVTVPSESGGDRQIRITRC
jgi:hypothetical protein